MSVGRATIDYARFERDSGKRGQIGKETGNLHRCLLHPELQTTSPV